MLKIIKANQLSIVLFGLTLEKNNNVFGWSPRNLHYMFPRAAITTVSTTSFSKQNFFCLHTCSFSIEVLLAIVGIVDCSKSVMKCIFITLQILALFVKPFGLVFVGFVLAEWWSSTCVPEYVQECLNI